MNENRAELIDLFLQINRLFHRAHMHHFKEYGPFSPHRGQGRVLIILKMQPEISQKELGYLLDMRNQSLGELLNKLEKAGYITRTPSEDDRRTMNIKLTESGLEAVPDIEQDECAVDNVFDCLNDEEKNIMEEYLQRIINAFKQRLGNDDAFERGCGDFPPPPPLPPHHPHPWHMYPRSHHHKYKVRLNNNHENKHNDNTNNK